MQNHERLALLHLLDLGNSRAGELSIPRSPPPQNSYLTRIHRRHTEEQLLYFQIYSEAVSVCTLHLKVFTVPWWYWRAFLHGLSTSSSELSPCHTSPLRCRRAASASSRRGWKAFLAAVCIWGTSCHSSGLICQCRIILSGRSAIKSILLGDHLLFTASITYVAASSQSFITYDPFAPHLILFLIFYALWQVHRSLVGPLPLPRAVSRDNKQVISVESRYICPKPVSHSLVIKEVSESAYPLLVNSAGWKSCQPPPWNHFWNCWLPASHRHMRSMCGTATNLLCLLNSPNVLAKIHLQQFHSASWNASHSSSEVQYSSLLRTMCC